MPQFWQNFPKAIEATNDSLTLRLFPEQFADVHELQGGEQKTHTFAVAFGAGCHSRSVGVVPAAGACLRFAKVVLRQRGDSCLHAEKPPTRTADYLKLVDAAIEGDDTFDTKREVIDEYGWRHFGDIYGDHEAVYHPGPQPMVSHYNNQYDPVAGFAYQFLRAGDLRWLRHMEELARPRHRHRHLPHRARQVGLQRRDVLAYLPLC